jgi:hypothetical protein
MAASGGASTIRAISRRSIWERFANVFNTLHNQTVHFQRAPAMPDCGTARSAIWSRPGVVYHAGTNRLFMATGNGNFNGDTGGFNWGDSIVAINPDGSGSSGKPIDAYTPTNQATLEAQDADLGSASPAILPVPPGAAYPFLAIQSGKDSKLRLVNLANLNGSGGQDHLAAGRVDHQRPPRSGSEPAGRVGQSCGLNMDLRGQRTGGAGLQLMLSGGGLPFLAPSGAMGRAAVHLWSPKVFCTMRAASAPNSIPSQDACVVQHSDQRNIGEPVLANGAPT